MNNPLKYLIAFALCGCVNLSFGQQDSRPENAPQKTVLGNDVITVPMKLVMNRPMVDVKINGKGPYPFVLDTGAGVNVLDPKLAEELELKSNGETKIGDPSNPQAIDVKTYVLERMSVGNAEFKTCSAVGWSAVTHIGARGIIGLPTFYDAVISLDYPKQKLTISRKQLNDQDGSVTYKADNGGHINIDLQVGGEKINAHLDTGNMGGITLPLSMANKLNLSAEPKVQGQAMTASGSFQIYSAPFDGQVKLAGMSMNPKTMTFNDRFEWANIGYQAFAATTLTIDQINRRIKLEKSINDQPMVQRKSSRLGGQPRYGVAMGMIGGGEMKIQQVIAGSIAEAAGLKAGDKVLKINGMKISDIDPFGRMTAFRKSPLTLTVNRDGAPVKIEMKFPDRKKDD